MSEEFWLAFFLFGVFLVFFYIGFVIVGWLFERL